jgi:SAM-dependent methyltransferase
MLDAVLACPQCHAAFRREGDTLTCTASGTCGFQATVTDGIVRAFAASPGSSFFDATFPVMVHGSDEPSAHAAFYLQQQDALRKRLDGARVVLDIGCGPRLPYRRPAGALVLGVDLSYESLRQNTDVDVRLYASATALPVPSRSVDAIVCFYSLHHLVGDTVRDNERLLRIALAEFARVLAPSGRLLVFEVAPFWMPWAAQRLGWNAARRALGRSLDMFFWRRHELARIVTSAFTVPVTLEYAAFHVPAFTRFPPAFTVQWLRIPRCLYPFDICMYCWQVP